VNGMITAFGRTVPAGQLHYHQDGPRNLSRFISGNRLTIPTATLESLVIDAYNVRPSEFGGLPSWATDGDFYEIAAKAEGEATLAPEQARLMLQTLLADRFQMKVHHEARSLPVYELTIAKNGTKLKEAAQDDRTGTPMGLIVSMLQNFVDHPVVNKTGLTAARYGMEWDQTELLDELNQGKPAPSIFHEVEAQLGLTLKAAKQETDFIVIDHVERLAEN
jgi:uncharacterized protein (TIGR03435 family)